MVKEKILITVKTYPTLSSTYDETVCTAGLREDGSWIRIYPIPFRKLDEFEQYKKFDWVEVAVERNLNDPRPESHKKRSPIRVLRSVDTKSKAGWQERNDLVLRKSAVFTSFEEIIAKNKNNRQLSLATFKPSRIVGLDITEDDREWDAKKIRVIENRAKQDDMFDSNTECFKIVNKLPYQFRYVFEEENGKQRKLLITDWEIGALFWKQKMRRNGDEAKVLDDIREMYLKRLVEERDIHFFVGTTHEWDMKNAPNPFTIIGVYSPPLVKQQPLF